MQLKTRSIKLMGATIDIAIYVEDDNKGESILEEVVRLLHEYNKRFSANDISSELMKINKSAGLASVVVHPELFELISLAKEHSTAEGSFFNLALGPIVKSWKIGFSDARVPTAEEVENLLPLTDANNIILDENESSVYLNKLGMEIDLGAIAKGYIADKIVQFLKKQEVKSGYINLGGNFLTFGTAYHNEDGFWRVGIQDPKKNRGGYVCALKIRDESVVTSGVYERVLELKGRKYHHIFNPKTGYPLASEVESITIVAKNSVTCEIWTTRLFGKKIDDMMDEIEENPRIEGIIITNKEEIYYTSGLEGKII